MGTSLSPPQSSCQSAELSVDGPVAALPPRRCNRRSAKTRSASTSAAMWPTRAVAFLKFSNELTVKLDLGLFLDIATKELPIG